MKKIRIDNIKSLRRHATRILNELLNDDAPEFEKYKLINSYFGTIGKTFQIENSKLQIEITPPAELTPAEIQEKLIRLQKIVFD